MPLNLLEMLSKPPIKIGASASAQMVRGTKPCGQERVPKHGGRDYAKVYISQEEELYKRSSYKNLKEDEQRGTLSEVDTVTNYISEITCEDAGRKVTLYDEFKFDDRKNAPVLPISKYKSMLLGMIEAYKVIIVKGATGCGKTTQIPQFILDECREKREPCSIVVTQPRRLAAISVAKRVCEERNWELGTVVGYQIGQQRVGSDRTAITYCTTGVLLQKLVQQKSLMGYTHIILDEVHERDAEMDFLLIIVRKFLNTVSRNVKVILMSATITTDNFSEYFYSISDNQRFQAPVLEATKEVNYPVKIYYLNSCTSIQEARLMKPDGPDITKKGYITALKIVSALDAMDKKDAESKKTKLVKGSVLIFLPGLYEIEEMKKHLDSMNESESQKEKREHEWWIVPLHSSITAEEQDFVFRNPPQNHRKIVLSTNIAESSLTVPDIKYVIDFCLTKVIVTDPKTNLSSLQLCWASKNNCTQRSGRVGRVMEGRVYRLVDEEFYEDLDEEPIPEMLRCPLDRLVLQTKLLDQGPPKAIFALALSQPDLRNIEQTVLTLKEIGALLVTTRPYIERERPRTEEEEKHYMDDFDGELTYLGRIIAKLPMDVRLGKLIFFGTLFNVLDECIIMACAMSVKNIFSTPFQAYLKAYNSKLTWSNSTCSDCIAFLNAYTVWRKKKAEGLFRHPNQEEKWCRERFLQVKALREMHALQQDVFNRIKSSQMFVPRKEKVRLEPKDKNLLLKLAFAAAFYPNYFLRGFLGGQVDEREAVATLCGHDPYTTVYLQGMPVNQPGILYKKSIEKHFEQVSSRVNVIFDSGSKVLINFGHSRSENIDGNSSEIPGKIDSAVYRAVKMRQLRSDIRIPIFNPEKADKKVQEYLEKYEQDSLCNTDTPYTATALPWPWNKNLDNITIEVFEICITHVESPTRFWAMSTSSKLRQELRTQIEMLSKPENVIPVQGDVKIGGIYLVRDDKDRRKLFYRCRLVSYKRYNSTYDVFFIDYGDMRFGLRRDEIMTYNPQLLKDHDFPKLPDLAVEFSLVKIQPPTECEGKWSRNAIDFLKGYKRKEFGERLYAKLYSVVNGVVRIKLYIEDERSGRKIKIIQQLIERKLAEKTDEVFLSKQDHFERKNLQKMITEGIAPLLSRSRNLTEKEKLMERLNALDIEEPKQEECSQEAILRGPFSPLEMRIFSAAQCSMAKLATIDRNSVNSVLLDTNPLDEHERVVVAAYVTINSSGDKLSLKDTTVMPSIPGLPSLICLLFSPMVELRCDSEFTKFTGALCGLGYDKFSEQSLNPDNDIEIVFDVEITLDTIVQINKIRYWLNRIVCYSVGEIDDVKIEDCQHKLTKYISELIWDKRHPQDLQYNTDTYKWNMLPHDKLLNPCTDVAASKMTEPADDTTCVYKLIWGIDLNGDPTIRLENVKKNLDTLYEFAAGRLCPKNFECMLCQITIPNKMNATLHFKSGLHKARAQKYLDMIDRYSDIRSECTEDREIF